MHFEKTSRSKLNRNPERGSFDKETIYNIIDEEHYCHVSFLQDDKPFVIPTIHARMDDNIILHGAKTIRMLKHILAGNEVCISITLIDGLVLARSVFHHSMNYRSVIIFGKGEEVIEKEAKLNALQTITDHLLPGRWEDARQPDEKELISTMVVSIKIEEASAKIRTGPPSDDEEDYGLPVWAGVLKLNQGFDKFIPDPLLNPDVRLPRYLEDMIKNS
ncbi:MAG: pyridoxamine 5'-phosphate oxidase family protein [Ignavibacteria bacterium]|nr:pyridoxamine 5'-phosphate oxidase family protein [Ignavibacteria bacterium]